MVNPLYFTLAPAWSHQESTESFFLRIAEVPESRGAKDQCGQSVFIHLLLTSVFAPDGLSTIFWELV